MLLLLGMLLCVRGKEAAGTKVTFFVEHEVDPQKDYLEIVVNIKA
jgi:hypothetical protein